MESADLRKVGALYGALRGGMDTEEDERSVWKVDTAGSGELWGTTRGAVGT